MRCSHCAPFVAENVIRGPAEFKSVAERVRAAFADGVLDYCAFESEQELAGQPSFVALDLAGPWPDVLQYHFKCPRCANRFAFSVETYPGAGGAWTPVSAQ